MIIKKILIIMFFPSFLLATSFLFFLLFSFLLYLFSWISFFLNFFCFIFSSLNSLSFISFSLNSFFYFIFLHLSHHNYNMSFPILIKYSLFISIHFLFIFFPSYLLWNHLQFSFYLWNRVINKQFVIFIELRSNFSTNTCRNSLKNWRLKKSHWMSRVKARIPTNENIEEDNSYI